MPPCLILLCVLAPALVLGRSANIVNGFDATPGEFPWQASFQLNSGFHFCGASIVSDRWLVTASHCVEGQRAENVKVVLGLHDQRQRIGNPVEYAISRIIAHPQYDSSTIANDITLIQTVEPIQMTANIQPVALPTQDQDFSDQSCEISGWGELGWNQGSPDKLQKLEVKVGNYKYCAWTANLWDNADRVCILPDNGQKASACRGDSGGPLVCDGTLVGAASYVFGQCSTTSPNVYASVAHFRGWIKEQSGL